VDSVFVVTLTAVIWLRLRHKRIEAERVAQLGIDVKLSPPRDSREKTLIKLPGLSVSMPSRKVAGEMPRNPDSTITPTLHVGQ
jgi:hypothetical protein